MSWTCAYCASWMSWPPSEATARLPLVTRVYVSTSPDPHATPTVLRSHHRRLPRNAKLPNPAQPVSSMPSPSATDAAQLAIGPKPSPRHASSLELLKPRRLAAAETTPNLQSKVNGCSYQRHATWHAPNLAARPSMRQRRRAISQHKLQQY